jgi:copper chaperone
VPCPVVPDCTWQTADCAITDSNKHAGVESYNVSLESQTAEITAADSLDYQTVLEKIKKTGKTVKSGEADGEVKEV